MTDKTHGVDYVPKDYKFTNFYPASPIELKTKDDIIAAYYAQLMQQADLIQEQDKLIAGLQTELAARDWQPIETAPIDTTILLCGDSYGKPEAGKFIVIGHYFRGNRFVEREADDANADIANHLMYLTHWQPLPTPPSEAK